jgi:hypothetical protein
MNTADVARRALLATACMILPVWIVSPSGAPAQQSAERPMVIDFYAIGADGASISDLKSDEVTIKIDDNCKVRMKRSSIVQILKAKEETPAAK